LKDLHHGIKQLSTNHVLQAINIILFKSYENTKVICFGMFKNYFKLKQ